MAFSELIKNFTRIRTYLREFYVFGFRHRRACARKSSRSYDNERRRVESWLGEYMSFGQDPDGKRVFLSVDSRSIPANPLFTAFRTKSFTDKDIMLHFHILDILSVSGELPVSAIMEKLISRIYTFDTDELPDESTVRRKLKEYVGLGILVMRKCGRETLYGLKESPIALQTWAVPLAFFSEAAPLGVAGSYIQDRIPEKCNLFRFKHHYILNVLDSEILFLLLEAIKDLLPLDLTIRKTSRTVLPLKIYIGTQTGRQYVLARNTETRKLKFYRLDLINKLKLLKRDTINDPCPDQVEDFCSHVWGVSGNTDAPLTHLEMTLVVEPGEDFILRRLEREKRCGSIRKIDDRHWQFYADVYDAFEMIPWLRSFTGRITDLTCSDQTVSDLFMTDLNAMFRMYGGDENDLS